HSPSSWAAVMGASPGSRTAPHVVRHDATCSDGHDAPVAREPDPLMSAAPPDTTQPTDVAVVGMACRVPGAADADAFWRNIRDGVESIRSYSIDELRAAGVSSALLGNPHYVPRGA